MKKLIIFFLFNPILAQSQVILGESQLLFEPELQEPTAVHLADLDGDGDEDLIVTATPEGLFFGNQGIDSKVVWYENEDGLGSFGTMQLISDKVPYANHIITTDLDRDSDLDIIACGSAEVQYGSVDKTYRQHAAIYVLENINNAADFLLNQKVQDIDLPNPQQSEKHFSYLIPDINGDTYPDILIADKRNRQIGFFLYNSIDRTYGNYHLWSYWYESIPQFTDFNKDGNIDMIYPAYTKYPSNQPYTTYNYIYRISWFETSFDSLPQFTTEHSISGDTTYARNIWIGDIENDGDKDVIATVCKDSIILSCSRQDNDIMVWYPNNDGIGTFSEEIIIDNDPSPILKCQIIDIENDGDSDIIILPSDNTKNLIIYENLDGLGHSWDKKTIYTSSYFINDFNLFDINQDGTMDLFIAVRLTDKVAWYESHNNSFINEHVVYENPGNFNSIRSADFDKDGDEDLLVGGATKINLFNNTSGSDQFERKAIIGNADSSGSVEIADINSDGAMDFITLSSDLISWYSNHSGSFNLSQIIAADSINFEAIACGDLDGDLDTDIVTYSAKNTTLVWFENMDGQGTFGTQNIIDTDVISGFGMKDIDIGDIDNDNDMDIIVTGTEYPLYLNLDGTGQFSPQPIKLTTDNTTYWGRAEFVDMDHDLDMDILIGNNILINNDTLGQFQSISISFNGRNYYSMDLNNDGNREIIVSSYCPGCYYDRGTTSYYMKEFNSIYQEIDYNNFLTGEYYSDNSLFHSADIDEDQDTDVLQLSRAYNLLYWRKNEGSTLIFEADTTYGIDSLTVQFSLLYDDPRLSTTWDFGDGTVSYETNPTHKYTTPGIFTVIYGATHEYPSDNHKKHINYITIEATPPSAAFHADTIRGFTPLTIHFTDTSTGNITSWLWDFGDGDTSHVQNPTHTYTKPDTYSMQLTVSGYGGIDSLRKQDYIIVREAPPVAKFSADSIQGFAPLTVQFTDSSTGNITSWLWDFGDGDTSHIPNPSHVYTEPDTYTVTLIVTGLGGTDTLTLPDFIIVQKQPISDLQNELALPTDYALSPVYPNPFNPAANIRFALPNQEVVRIQIYNIRGEMVDQANLGTKEAGYHNWTWDANRFSTGAYFVRIQAGSFHEVRKCVLMK